MTKNSDLKLIETNIQKLRNLTEIDIQNNWLFCDQDLAIHPQWEDVQQWEKFVPNSKQYLTWKKGKKVKWLSQKIVVPSDLNSYLLTDLSLLLVLTWWAEKAEIFVNGKLVQEGDLFDSSARILLTSNAKYGQEFLITLRLVSPNHDIGALMRSKCVYEINRKNNSNFRNKLSQVHIKKEFETRNLNLIDAGFVANELEVITNYLKHFHINKIPLVAQKILLIDWENIGDRRKFHQSLLKLRSNLNSLSEDIKKRSFYPLGHAHLDMAWLWETKETYEVAQRTFKSVLNLQKKFSNLTFGHTTACLYEWIEKHDNSLFLEIQKAVKKGKWEILGGMWVEPEVNLISGESLIRQLLYGQKYFQNKFGNVNKVAWLPDTFGFPWQLPQILKLSEIEYFVTGKLHWNDTNKFPYPCFWWQSPDGTKIFTSMSPPNITGVMDTNPITMTNYATEWEKQTGLQDIFWLPGVGDHGGGPTRDMLEVAEVYADSPFFPNIEFTTANSYLNKIANSRNSFPIWNDELYLELHRGCYTTHGDQKYFNRYSENLLYQVELWSTIATLLSEKGYRRGAHFPIMKKNNIKREKSQSNISKNQKKIEDIWKKILFNQFHDILPGTSIPEVFVEANQNWQSAIEKGEEMLSDSLKAIASYLDLSNKPHPEAKAIAIFNSLNWQRSQIVEVKLDQNKAKIYDENGQKVITQISRDQTLLFLAKNIPSVGYKIYWLCPQSDEENQPQIDQKIDHKKFVLENEFIKVNIDLKTGNIDSLFDKNNKKEVVNGLANQLQFFEDKGQYWDAWNIYPDYQKKSLPSAQLKSTKWLEKGKLRSVIRVVKIFQNSEFIQDYILEINSPFLKIKNTVNWQEDHVLVKVAFPLTINSDKVTYEIACGAIARTTKPKTEEEKAKWEVYGHNWADLSINNYGVSLLNDCKYGYDSTPNQLRLSLLRSPKWPNPKADRGVHHFTYAIYPHNGNWKKANTVQQGYQLNIPLQLLLVDKNQQNSQNKLPLVNSFLDLGENSLVLMAFKQSENDEEKFILRLYESCGERVSLNVNNKFDLEIDQKVNCLENSLTEFVSSQNDQNSQDLTMIKKWEIANFKLKY